MRSNQVTKHSKFFQVKFSVRHSTEAGIVQVGPRFSAARASVAEIFPLVVKSSLEGVPPRFWFI